MSDPAMTNKEEKNMIPPFTQEEMDEILAETRRLNYWVEPEKVQGDRQTGRITLKPVRHDWLLDAEFSPSMSRTSGTYGFVFVSPYGLNWDKGIPRYAELDNGTTWLVEHGKLTLISGAPAPGPISSVRDSDRPAATNKEVYAAAAAQRADAAISQANELHAQMREALLAVQEGRRRAAEDRAAAAERRARRGQMDSQTAEYKAIKITRDAELQAEEAEREARKAEREARQAEREAERFERQAERFQREAERNARQAERQARQMERDAMQMERDARKMERDAERMQREFIPSAATASTSSSDWVCTDITPDGIYKWRLDSESIEIELWEGLNPNERVPLPGRTIMVKGSLLSNGSREWKTPDGLCTMLLEEGRNPKDNNMSGVIIGGGANGDLRSVVFNGRNGLVVFPKFTCL